MVKHHDRHCHNVPLCKRSKTPPLPHCSPDTSHIGEDHSAADEDRVPSTYDYCVWIVCVLLEAAVVVTAARSHAFRRYIFLNIYMASSLVVSAVRYQVLHRAGLASEYAYVCYYSDALLTIGLYFVLLNLYSLVFDEMKVERYLRLGAILLLGGTAWFS